MRKSWMRYAAAAVMLAVVASGCGQKASSENKTQAVEAAAGKAAEAAVNKEVKAPETEVNKEVKAPETEVNKEVKAPEAAEIKKAENTAGGAASSEKAAAEEAGHSIKSADPADKEEGSAEQAAGQAMIRMTVCDKQENLFLPEDFPEDGKEAAFVKSARLVLSEEDEKKWPGLAETLEKISQEELQITEDAKTELIENARELRENQGGNARSLSEEMDVSPGRMDEEAVSFLRARMTDIGGAHNYWEFRAWTIDPGTGEILKLTDIVKDRNKLPKLIVEAMQEEYSEELSLISDSNPEKVIEETLKKYEEAGVDIWYLTPEGLEVLFGPYVLDLGFSEQRALIRYADHPEVFRIKAPEYPTVYRRDISMPETWASENGSCSAYVSHIETDWENYPELYESLYQYNEDVDQRAKAYIEEMRKFGKTAGDAFFCEEMYITSEILRLDGETLTILETTSLSGVDEKTAEKAYSVQEYSFDIKTGKKTGGT